MKGAEERSGAGEFREAGDPPSCRLLDELQRSMAFAGRAARRELQSSRRETTRASRPPRRVDKSARGSVKTTSLSC